MWHFTFSWVPHGRGWRDGIKSCSLVVSALVICSRLRNLLVIKFSIMKTVILPLKVSSYQDNMTKLVFSVLSSCLYYLPENSSFVFFN